MGYLAMNSATGLYFVQGKQFSGSRSEATIVDDAGKAVLNYMYCNVKFQPVALINNP